MKSKSIIILVIALALLGAIYLIQNLSSDKKSVSETYTDLYSELDTASVVKIKVYKELFPDSGLAFTKKDTNWVVSSYYDAPAKVNDITKLFADLAKLQGEVRSTSKDLFSDYAITDNEALHIEFLGADSSVIAHVLFGKGVPEMSQAGFTRNFDSDTVYIANQNFISRFAVWNAEPAKRMPAKRWIELKIGEFDNKKIKSIELNDGKNNYLFEKHEEVVKEDTIETTKAVWVQTRPAKNTLDEKTIEDIAGKIGSFKAIDIVGIEILPEYKLDNAKQNITVTADGANCRISFGAESDTTSGARYAKVDNKPFVYTINKNSYEALFVNPFKKK